MDVPSLKPKRLRGVAWLGVVVDDRRYAEQSVRWPNVSGVLSSVVITH
ncbi:MAG: hypothetical protein ACK4XK_12025 [Casimicrobiaceae bacterium]